VSRTPDIDTERITAHVIPGEYVLWVCRPHFRLNKDVIRGIVAIGWVAFIICMYVIEFIGIFHAVTAAIRFILAVTLVIIAVGGTTFFFERRRRAVLYAVTSARVLILRRGSLTALPLRALAEWACIERGNGYGDLLFGRIHRVHLSNFDDVPPTGLYNISNVRAVQLLLDSAQRAIFNLPPRDPKLAASLAID